MNSEYLNSSLLQLSVAERDEVWTEWVRRNVDGRFGHSGGLLTDLKAIERDWLRNAERTESDRLLALWVRWYLASSVRYFRDHATRALYSYGLCAPRSLFELAVTSFTIDDPYVAERMLAATYGVVMANQHPTDQFTEAFEWLISQTSNCLLGHEAEIPTNHWTTRQYVQGIFDFARHAVPNVVTNVTLPDDQRLFFGQANYVAAAEVDQQYTGYLDMDFENDEVGRLFEDRRKY